MSVQVISDQGPAKTVVSAAPIAAPARVQGVIVLARHGEPDLSRKLRMNAAGYVDWWARYEEIGLKAGQIAPDGLKLFAEGAQVILCSTRPRSIETAKAVAEGRVIQVDPGLIEAPLPPPSWPSWFKLSPRIWGVVARVHWWIGQSRGEESRAEAQCRADAAAERLSALAANGDVLVLAHGYFNTMIGLSLQRDGWKLKSSEGYRYWAMRRFERKRGMIVTAAGELAAAVLEN
jgi:broad specificity phosphatase PhoE